MKRFLSLFSRARSNISCKFHPTRLLVLFLLYSSMIAEGFTSATLTDALNSPISDQTNSTEGNDDPWEEFNRGVFGFNQVVDEYVLGPLAEVYQALLPTSTQECIHNFLSNLSSPLVLINDVAQFEGDRAMDTLARFLVNTTLGLGGLFDPAQEVLGINYHYEDFGLTLGTYGVENSPYLVLPFLGPSNIRDTLGLGVDFVIDPVRYAARHRKSLNYIRYGADTIDKRVQADKVLKQVNAALDPYIFMRTLYQQNRNFGVQKGMTDLESPTPSDE